MPTSSRTRALGLASLSAATLAAAGVFLAGRTSGPAARPAYLPDPRFTPGEVIPGVGRAETCDPAWTHRSRNVPESLRRAVLARYGRPDTPATRAGVEFDHKVPVALAGASTVGNVWPEPWDGVWGARVKDRLEAALYRDVCAGRVTLRDAQSVFLGNWRVEYLRRWGDPTAHKVGATMGEDEGEYDGEGFPREAMP